MPRSKKGKYMIVLKNINIADVIMNNFNTKDIPDTPIQPEISDEVSISSLLQEKSNRCIYFLDQYKNRIKYWVNMIDYTQNGALPLYTNKPCWGPCRSTFNTHPIGCPIKYNSHKEEGLEKERIEKHLHEMNLTFEKNDFFETVGIFCSFPCVKAYIYDEMSRGNRARYKDSLTLLTLMYEKLFGEKITIPKAGDYKLLKEYGGHLTPEELRGTFGRLEYEETTNLRRPYMFSSSVYIKETRMRI